MIIAATATQLTQLCPFCNEENVVLYSTIVAGVNWVIGRDGDSVPTAWSWDVDNVQLPACPTCTAIETLIRSWDGPSSRHGRGVNAVHDKLVELGYVNTHCADDIAAETEAPLDVATLPWALGA